MNNSPLKRKRIENEQDPDYEDVVGQERERLHLLEESARAEIEEKVRDIIKKDFGIEHTERSRQLFEIQKTLNKAQETLNDLRYVVVAQRYSSASIEIPKVDGDSTPQEQTRIHPAVKKLLGYRETLKNVTGKRRISKLNESVNRPSVSAPSTTLVKELLTSDSDVVGNKLPRYVPPIPKQGQESCNYDRNIARKELKRLLVGNVSRWLPVDTREDRASHKWMLYVRFMDNDNPAKYISKVRYLLHPSYKPNDVVEVKLPPFHLSRRGWGEFQARVQVHFHNAADKPLDIRHDLKLDRTYTGLETLGSETHINVWLTSFNDHEESIPDKPTQSDSNSESEEQNACSKYVKKEKPSIGDSPSINRIASIELEPPDILELSQIKPVESVILSEKTNADEENLNSPLFVPFVNTVEHIGLDMFLSDTNIADIEIEEEVVEMDYDDTSTNEIDFDEKEVEEMDCDVETAPLEGVKAPAIDGKSLPLISIFHSSTSKAIPMSPSHLKHSIQSTSIQTNSVSRSILSSPSTSVRRPTEPLKSVTPAVKNTNMLNRLSPSIPPVQCPRAANANALRTVLPTTSRIKASPKVASFVAPGVSGYRGNPSLIRANKVSNDPLSINSPTKTATTAVDDVQLTPPASPRLMKLRFLQLNGKTVYMTVNPKSIAKSSSVISPIKTKPNLSVPAPRLSTPRLQSTHPLLNQNGLQLIPVMTKLSEKDTLLLTEKQPPNSTQLLENAQSILQKPPALSTLQKPTKSVTVQKAVAISLSQNTAKKDQPTSLQILMNGHVYDINAVPKTKPTAPKSLLKSGMSLLKSSFQAPKAPALQKLQPPPFVDIGVLKDVIECQTNIDKEKEPLPIQMERIMGSKKSIEMLSNPNRMRYQEILRQAMVNCFRYNMTHAVKVLAKDMPLADPTAADLHYRAIHPYCSVSSEVFLQMSVIKKQAHEWLRAKAISRCLLEAGWSQDEIWTTRQIVQYTRQHGFTPSIYDVQIKTEDSYGRDYDSYSEPLEIMEWLSKNPSEDIESKEEEVVCEEIDVVNDAPMPIIVKAEEDNTVDNSHLALMKMTREMRYQCEYIRDGASELGVRFQPEEIVPGMLYHSAERVMLEALKSFMDDLIRRSLCEAWERNSDRPPEEIKPCDVKSAIMHRTEFDILTNSGLGTQPMDVG